MKINLKDNNNNILNVGDKVQILKITDDSGNASDLFGVEPELNGWVNLVYIELFKGIITFDEDKLMVVIKGDRRSLPLSNSIRYNIWNDIFQLIDKQSLKDIIKEYNLCDIEYDTIINYLIKIK
jgi:hypothetical protein